MSYGSQEIYDRGVGETTDLYDTTGSAPDVGREPDVTEDTSIEVLGETDLGTVEDLATDNDERYVEAYLEESLHAVTDLFEDMGLDMEVPGVSYQPERQDSMEHPPLLQYDPSEDEIVFIRAPEDEDRPLEPSLLGVIAHELWHSHFERSLRDRYGFIHRERPDSVIEGTTGAAFDTETGDYREDVGMVQKGYLASSMSLDTYGVAGIYTDAFTEAMNGTKVQNNDPLTGEELDVDETMPDVNLAGLDEALAHVLTLTLDGAVHDAGTREAYWSRLRERYNEQAEEHGFYVDRTGDFGDEIAVLGEYIASTFVEGTDDDLDRLGAVLGFEQELIEEGLLDHDPI